MEKVKNMGFKNKHLLVNVLFLLLSLASLVVYFNGKFGLVQAELVLLVLLTLTLATYFFVRKSYLNPFQELKMAVQSPENEEQDGVQAFLESHQSMAHNISSATEFIRKIEKGNLDEAEINTASGALGASLVSMKEHLKNISLQEKERIWNSEGLARFSDILRANDADIRTLGLNVLSFLTKYIKANQAALFAIQEDGYEECMEMVACYAFDKKKYLSKTILKGQGLVGRAWIEQDTIYMTQVPQNYVEITSGLGQANPSCILIVPLKFNEEVYGVIELASFSSIPKYQIEFIEKVSENLASTISMVKVNERTRKLLEESQEMTEQMRAQEEEMRQNLEELTATQEELQRKEAELDKKLKEALKEIELSQVNQQLNEIALQIEHSIESSKGDLKFLSNVPPVQGLVRAMANNNFDSQSNSSYEDWIERMDTIFRNFLLNKELFQSITFTNEEGTTIYELSFVNRKLQERTIKDGLSYQDQEIFVNTAKLQKAEVYVGQVKELSAKTIVMEFGIPIFNEQNRLKGTILVHLFTQSIIEGIKSKEDGENFFGLFTSEGICIYGHNRPANIGLKKVVVTNQKQNLSLTIMHQ